MTTTILFRRLVAVLVAAAVVIAVIAGVEALRRHSGEPAAHRQATVNVTITPGQSRQQTEQALRRSGIDGDYLKQTVSSKLLDPAQYGAPAPVPSLEGFLWPDTYNVYRPVKVDALVADQLARFKQEFAQVDLSYAQSKNLTAYDVLKIASLIEGEAQLSRDAPVVASVIYNRLRAGMDLGMDSTVEYATGHYGALTEQDLRSSSPWNTRNHPGLPPTPIDSPDLETIQAAAHPAQTDFIYFVNRVCGNGALRFTANYSQFARWSAAWNAALRKARRQNSSAEFCAGKAK